MVRTRKVRQVAALLLTITVRMISNCNRTEWSTIQGVIQWASDLKLRARLALNYATQGPITN